LELSDWCGDDQDSGSMVRLRRWSLAPFLYQKLAEKNPRREKKSGGARMGDEGLWFHRGNQEDHKKIRMRWRGAR
jgi:hypothetical protein